MLAYIRDHYSKYIMHCLYKYIICLYIPRVLVLNYYMCFTVPDTCDENKEPTLLFHNYNDQCLLLFWLCLIMY